MTVRSSDEMFVACQANITGGGLVVCVEARSAAPGEFASPLQLRLRTRGSRDPVDKVTTLSSTTYFTGSTAVLSQTPKRAIPLICF